VNPKRRFHVLDGLILIAFTAVGFALCIAWESWVWSRLDGPRPINVIRPVLRPQQERLLDPLHTPYGSAVSNLFSYFRLLLIGWTLAFLLLRLRKPRPPIRRLVSLWGTSGCITALLLLLFLALDTAWEWTYPELFPLGSPVRYDVTFGEMCDSALSESEVWAAIIATWFVLKIGNRLRCERSWIEYFGMFLSAGWISNCFEDAIQHFTSLL
jgi:hypothetical protein